METKILLNKIIDRTDLTVDEAEFLLDQIVKGELNNSQIAAVLIALRTKGESVAEITGFIAGMRKHMVGIKAPDAIDIVGTGGDGVGTFNISTAASLVVASCGVKVAKHGNRAASSKCGSADVLEALGVNIMLKPQQAQEVLQKVGMVFLFAPLYHPAMKNIAPIRRELGVRTVFNFLGPFLNPANVKRALIGVPNVDIAKKLARVAAKLNYEHLLLVASRDGMDEISISGKTQGFIIKKNSIREMVINPQMYGFGKSSITDILGGDRAKNARIITDILDGKKGAARDVVIINSAYALYVAGRVKDVPAGIDMAKEAIDSGEAKKVLQNLVKETRYEYQISNIKYQIDNNFYKAMVNPKKGRIAVIGEIKFASPTEPRLGVREDLIGRAKQYQQAGADAISLIVEPNVFKGDLSDVAKVKKAVSLPILVKDFVTDESKIYQIKKAGADAILLIAKLVDSETLVEFVVKAAAIGLEPVVEINTEEDLQKALMTNTKIIAVNARNLDTFEVDVEGACQLLSRVPDKFFKLGFSGINGKAEVDKYKKAGAKGVLVGTSLMKAKNIKEFIGGLRG